MRWLTVYAPARRSPAGASGRTSKPERRFLEMWACLHGTAELPTRPIELLLAISDWVVGLMPRAAEGLVVLTSNSRPIEPDDGRH